MENDEQANEIVEEKSRKNLEEKKELMNEEKLDNSKKIHAIPDKVDIIRLSKSGSITIPKKIRENLEENTNFAFWQEDNRFIFQILDEQEFQKIKAAQALSKEARIKRSSTTTKRKTTHQKTKKNVSGPEPELTKYFPFQIANAELIKDGMENTFYILMEKPPEIEQSIERLKYIILNYSNGNKTNDSRLRNSIIILINDVIKKNTDPTLYQLLNFAYDKIIPHITSSYLKDQSLVHLFLSSATVKNESISDLSEKILNDLFCNLENYQENYAIMQGFKIIVRSIKKEGLILSDALKFRIRDEIRKFIDGFSTDEIEHPPLSTDLTLEMIDLLKDLHLIVDANKWIEELLQNLPPEDMFIERVREKLKELRAIPL